MARLASLATIFLLLADAPSPAGPELYGAGLFSTRQWDFFTAVSPERGPGGVLFCRANDDFSAYDIYETRQEANQRWRIPIKPSFAQSWSNADPHFSPDGRTLFSFPTALEKERVAPRRPMTSGPYRSNPDDGVGRIG